MRQVEEEVSLCLADFTRLCVAESVLNDDDLGTAAISVARRIHQNFPAPMSDDLKRHFEDTLSSLVDVVSALKHRITPEMLKDYCEKSTQAQVANTLCRSIASAIERSKTSSPSLA